jgi:hypothetical protein
VGSEEQSPERGFFSRLFTKKQATASKEATPTGSPDDNDAALAPQPIQEYATTSVMTPTPEEAPSILPETTTDVQPSAPEPTVEQTTAPSPAAATEPVKTEGIPAAPPPERTTIIATGLENKLIGMADTLATITRPRLSFADGTPILTIKDLEQHIATLTPTEFKDIQEAGDFRIWAAEQHLSPDLGEKLQAAKGKREALSFLKGSTTRPVEEPQKSVPLTNDEIVKHFDEMAKKETASWAELRGVIDRKDATPTTSVDVKELLVLKNGKAAETIANLATALELLDDRTYQGMVTGKKEDLQQKIAELAQKAAKVAALDIRLVRERMLAEIDARERRSQDLIAQTRKDIQEQAKALLAREDEILNKEDGVERRKKELKSSEEALAAREEKWAKQIKEQTAILEKQRQDATAWVEEQRQSVTALETKHKAIEISLRKVQAELDERKELAAKTEAELAARKRQVDEEIARRKEEVGKQEQLAERRDKALKGREARLEEDRKILEESMQKREKLVQETVDKILAIDRDIDAQRADVERMRKEVDAKGFENYLKSALQELESGTIIANRKQTAQQPTTVATALIDECTRAIEQGRLEEAQTLYQQLKEMYRSAMAGSEEKEILFDAIREIYTAINLAALDRGNAAKR